MDDTGRTEPGDNPDPDRDDPDRPGWAAPQPPPSAPPPPPPGSQPPWTAEAQQPPPAPQQWNAPPQPQPPPASQQWGAQAPPPAPQWGAPPAPASGGPPTQPGWNAPPGAPPAWNAPAPPGPSGPPGAPGKRRGWAWLWALIVGLVVLTGVAVAGVVVAVSAYTKPADATNAYLRDVRDGQYAAAYAHLCSTTQSQTSLDEFRSQQQSNSAGDQIDTFDVYYSVIHGSGNTATTRYTIQRFFTRERWEVDLVKESGDWRPCTFTQLRY